MRRSEPTCLDPHASVVQKSVLLTGLNALERERNAQERK